MTTQTPPTSEVAETRKMLHLPPSGFSGLKNVVDQWNADDAANSQKIFANPRTAPPKSGKFSGLEEGTDAEEAAVRRMFNLSAKGTVAK